ncbi:hypothetical protein ACTSKR_11295 [Chitinibacteraceae bacterium HSL-7]
MTTLSDGATTLDLGDLMWADEFSWAATEQSVARSLSGALIVQTAVRQGGRPITLRNADDRSGWLTREEMTQLSVWANSPGKRLTLTVNEQVFLVIFRHHDGGPFEASPVVFYSDPVSGDYMLATLRFMTVLE